MPRAPLGSLALLIFGALTAAPLPARAGTVPRWREHLRLQTHDHSAFYDPGRDRLVALGGIREGAAALPLEDGASWRDLFSEPRESSFWFHAGKACAWDAANGLAYFTAPGRDGYGVFVVDPDVGDPVMIAASGEPPPAPGQSLVFDPLRRQLVLFGVAPASQTQFQLWVLDLDPTPVWTRVLPSGTTFDVTYAQEAVHDPVRDRVIVFVGRNREPRTRAVWALSLGRPVWTRLADSPLDLENDTHGVAYDPTGDRVVTVDGRGIPRAFSLATHIWAELPQRGARPAPRLVGAVTVDPLRNRLLLSGGRASGWTDVWNDVWALSLGDDATWSALVPPVVRAPYPARAAAHDVLRNRLLVFSNTLVDFELPPVTTWALDLGAAPAWSQIPTPEQAPRILHAAGYDPRRDRVIALSERDGAAELWSLALASPASWTSIAAGGAPRAAANGATWLYDAARDRFLLLFAEGLTSTSNQVWELRLDPAPAWRQLAPEGPGPSARFGIMAIVDEPHDRLIVFGGQDLHGDLETLWSLDLGNGDGTWRLLPTPPGPVRRNSGILRLVGPGRALLFGGSGYIRTLPWGTREHGPLNDVWGLELTAVPTWTPIEPVGARPSPRATATAVWDAAHDRLLVAQSPFQNDLWALHLADELPAADLAFEGADVTLERVRLRWHGAGAGTRASVQRRESTGAWHELGIVIADLQGHLVYEDRAVTAGARYDYRLGVEHSGQAEFHGQARVEVPRPALALAASSREGRAILRVTLPGPGVGTLALYDVRGRRLWTRDLGGRGAGPHEIDAGAWAPGLYFARVVRGAETRRAKLVLVR